MSAPNPTNIPPNPSLLVSARPSWARPLDTTDDLDPALPPRPLANSYWATPLLLASEYPGGPTEEVALPRLAALVDVGVVDFIDLTEEGELVPYDTLLEETAMQRGLQFQRMPNSTAILDPTSQVQVTPEPSELVAAVSDWHVTPREPTALRYGRFSIPDRSIPTPATLQSVLSALTACGLQNRKAVIHCWGGIGRTGTVVGCWYVVSGQVHDSFVQDVARTAGENALELLAKKWMGVDKSWRAPRTPENASQAAVVRTFRPFGTGK